MLSNLSTAIDFTFSSPAQIELNEEFSISIAAAEKSIDNHDVKVTILDEIGNTISLTFEDRWRSSYYYIKSSFPDKKDYLIKAINISENSKICVRLRETGASKYAEKCSPIIIKVQSPSINSKESNDLIFLDKPEAKKTYYSNEFKVLISLSILFLIILILTVIFFNKL